ncbi:hypothetical protein YDYSY3_59760 [Paenibacillus chitinolyticus]|nr:hypothetical protein YDYSY3_59760 [Paenibacillus chitinolyticus]
MILIFKLVEMDARRPTGTNSVVPMPNALIARASNPQPPDFGADAAMF